MESFLVTPFPIPGLVALPGLFLWKREKTERRETVVVHCGGANL